MQNLLCQRGVQLIRDILRSLGESAAGESAAGMKCSLEHVLLVGRMRRLQPEFPCLSNRAKRTEARL